jgi:hypothetical protein
MMRRGKRDGNHSPPKSKVVQGSESKNTKKNYTKEPNEDYRNYLKEEILQVINENFLSASCMFLVDHV